MLRQASVESEPSPRARGGSMSCGVDRVVGTSGLRNGPLQRCFRDIHAGTQHFFASPAATLDLGRDLMASAPDRAIDA